MASGTQSLVILAAGQGSRFGGPKQIFPLGPQGQCLFHYSLEHAAAAGFNHFVFITNDAVEPQLRALIPPLLSEQAQFDFIPQRLDSLVDSRHPVTRTKPWGTAHALLCAYPLQMDTFAVINADDYYGPFAYQAFRSFIDASLPAALVTYELGKTLSAYGSVSRGICQLTQGNLIESVQEHTQITAVSSAQAQAQFNQHSCTIPLDSPVSLNAWALSKEYMECLMQLWEDFYPNYLASNDTEFQLPTTISQFCEQNQTPIHSQASPDHWLGVTYQEDIPWVQEQLNQVAISYTPR